MTHLADDLLRHARRAPDGPLLLDESGGTLTYGEAARRALSLAGALDRRGVKLGQRVLILLPNGSDYLAAYYGTLLMGATAVALQPQTTNEALRYIAANCEPALCIVDGDTADLDRSVLGTDRVFTVAELVGGPAFGEDPRGGGETIAQIIYTSGTTGRSKGVTLSHGALHANTSSIVEYLRLGPDDRVGVLLDFVYSYGNSLLLTHCRVGGSLALLGSLAFPKRVVDLLGERKCTGLSGVPSTFALLLQRGHLGERPLPHLRYLTCAGGPLPEANLHRLQQLLPEVDIYLMYGQTEASARLSYLPLDQLERRPRSIGKGIPGVALEVLKPDEAPVQPGQEGEIVAAGANLMSGYWRDPLATAEVLRGGRLWTGDLATVDEDGFIFITGRKSDLIKTGAYRVHPKEIEEAIVSMPDVHQCVVVGVPDPTWGEIVVACFPEGQAPELAEVRRHLRGRLPDYKWPRKIVELAEVPRTASGKPKRQSLARRLAGPAG